MKIFISRKYPLAVSQVVSTWTYCLFFLFTILSSPENTHASSTIQSEPSAEVVIGSVNYLEKPVRVGTRFGGSGKLTTKEKSFLRISVPNWSSSIVVGPNTEMDLNFRNTVDPSAKRYELKNGLCRWISNRKPKDKKENHVFTKSAAMGIRGTDFEILHDESTGSTTLVVFQGEVEFRSLLDSSTVLVKANQTSRVGGQFGKSVSKPKELHPAEREEAEARLSKHMPTKLRESDSETY